MKSAIRFSGDGINCFVFISVLDFGFPEHIISWVSHGYRIIVPCFCSWLYHSIIHCMFQLLKDVILFLALHECFVPKCVCTCNTHLYLLVILLLLNSIISMNFLHADCFIYFTVVKAPGEYEFNEMVEFKLSISVINLNYFCTCFKELIKSQILWSSWVEFWLNFYLSRVAEHAISINSWVNFYMWNMSL